MRQRAFRLLARLFLLIIVGTGRLLWTGVCTVVCSVSTSLLAVGGVVAISQSSDAPTVQHLLAGFRPAGHMILVAGVVVLAFGIALHGVRS